MKTYIHARLTKEDQQILDQLKQSTGCSGSELVRRGLRLVRDTLGHEQSALDLAGSSVGKFKRGPRDLSTNQKHLEGFGR